MPDPRPNLLVVMTDQHRFDMLGCLGHPELHTPNLDALAGRGVTFTDAYTPSPVCGPARCSLFTGQFPPGNGAVGNWVPFHDGVSLLPERLQRLGYETACCGKLHFSPPEPAYGFDHKRINDVHGNRYANDAEHSDYVADLRQTLYAHDPDEPVRRFDDDETQYPDGEIQRFILGANFIPESHHITKWTTDEAIGFLDQRDEARPFFLFASYFGPHQPYAVPEPWGGRYDPDDVELPPQFYSGIQGGPVFSRTKGKNVRRFRAQLDEADYHRCIAAYMDNVTMLDAYIGRLFDTLGQRGLWDNTMVVFLSDHGDQLGRHQLFFKGDMYEGSARVPLIIKPAGQASALPRRVTQPVNTLDLYGTLLDAAGDDGWRGPEIEAGTLSPRLAGGDSLPRDVFAIHGKSPDELLTMLRRGPMKLIRLSLPEENHYELYDLGDAVPEMRDVASDPAYQSSLAELRAALDPWTESQRARMNPDPSELTCYAK